MPKHLNIYHPGFVVLLWFDAIYFAMSLLAYSEALSQYQRSPVHILWAILSSYMHARLIPLPWFREKNTWDKTYKALEVTHRACRISIMYSIAIYFFLGTQCCHKIQHRGVAIEYGIMLETIDTVSFMGVGQRGYSGGMSGHMRQTPCNLKEAMSNDHRTIM